MHQEHILLLSLGSRLGSKNNRLIAADLNKGSVQIFNSSGTWQKNFGGAPTTRMQAAQAAIKSIVTDASLTSGVNLVLLNGLLELRF